MKIRKLFWVICFLLIAILSGCLSTDNHKDNQGDKDPNENTSIEVKKSSKSILTGTIYETEVSYFKTNVSGPKILIIGGIHGDELAGWHAALRMLDHDFTFGEVVILPKASILATQLELRYPGQKNKGLYDGVVYSDLNRAFPGSKDGTPTEQIAYQLATFIDEEDPDIVLDLHESLKNYVDGYLGNQVIYGNVKSSIYALDLVDEFNEQFTTSNNVRFRVDNNPPIGSINAYCSLDEDRIVFTLETDRRLQLEERILQQMTLIKIFLSQIK